MSSSKKGQDDFWSLEIERQKAKSQRLQKEWEEKKKCEAEANAIPILPKSTTRPNASIYLPDPEDVAKYERERQEEKRKMEEEQKRTELLSGFDIRAALASVIWGGFLTIIGIAIAKCFTNLFEKAEPEPWVLIFIVSTAMISVFYQEIKEYIVSKHIIAWKKSKEYITEEESITEFNNSKKSFIKKMVVISLLYYAMYLLVTLTIGLIFFILLALGGLFNYRAIRWRPWNP